MTERGLGKREYCLHAIFRRKIDKSNRSRRNTKGKERVRTWIQVSVKARNADNEGLAYLTGRGRGLPREERVHGALSCTLARSGERSAPRLGGFRGGPGKVGRVIAGPGLPCDVYTPLLNMSPTLTLCAVGFFARVGACVCFALRPRLMFRLLLGSRWRIMCKFEKLRIRCVVISYFR